LAVAIGRDQRNALIDGRDADERTLGYLVEALPVLRVQQEARAGVVCVEGVAGGFEDVEVRLTLEGERRPGEVAPSARTVRV